MPHEGEVYLRYSIQAFNSQDDLDILYDAIEDIIKTTELIEIWIKVFRLNISGKHARYYPE